MPQRHEITELRRVGRGEREDVYVDGEREWRLNRRVIEKLGLAVGQRLSPGELAELRRAVSLHQAKEYALRALAQRGRTTSDLRQRLLTRGLSETIADEIVAWLVDKGLLDDELYTQDRVTTLQRRRLGSRAIEYRLQAEGVSRDLARDVLSERADELHETELARELAAELNDRWRKDDWLRRRNRIYQALARRGFDSEAISDALAHLPSLGEEAETDGEA